jgi:hypothetical protein
MFDNPILFALLIGVIASLLYFFVNKDKDKVDKNPNKNTKYLVVFGIVFVVSLIGKICYGSKILDNIDERVDKMLGGSSLSVSNDMSNSVSDSIDSIVKSSTGGETPPF